MRWPPDKEGCWAKTWPRRPREAPTDWEPEHWLSLTGHCLDVAACAAALLGYQPTDAAAIESEPSSLQPSVLRRRLARLGDREDLSSVHCARLCIFVGLHDFGKANRGFQRKAFATPGRKAGHLREALGIVLGDEDDLIDRWVDAIGWEGLSSWTEGPKSALCLLTAAVCHHGRVVEPDTQGLSEIWSDNGSESPLTRVAELRNSLDAAFPEAAEPDRPLPSTPGFQHAFCGLVQLADWIGSDHRRFPIDRRRVGEWTWHQQRGAATVKDIGLLVNDVRLVVPPAPTLGHLVADTEARLEPRPMQRAVTDLPPTKNAPSITLIEDETGSGKTEAALLHFARLFAQGEVDGLFFALPTRTAAVQIFGRIKESWAQLAGPDRPAVILAVPGYLRADDAVGERLPGFEFRWDEGGDSRRGDDRDAHRYWSAEHGKRFLAGCVVVGTVDQVLLSALAVPHHHMRATPLLRHLLVVDEVHASDAYMTAVLRTVLRRHRQAGGHSLLLSATLGAAAAAQLLEPERRVAEPNDVDADSRRPYPLLRINKAEVTVKATSDQRTVEITCEAWISDRDQVAEVCCVHAEAGARVLVIRNTVSGCRDLFERIAARDPSLLLQVTHRDGSLIPVPHHGRYAAEDRRLLDAAVEASLGKSALRDRGMVVVATQTCEQSLDIDADILITDLCPGDVLLQRIGRLHRHHRVRPSGYKDPRALVLTPDQSLLAFLDDRGKARSPRGTGLGLVYEDLRVLEATWEALQRDEFQPLRLPAANRALVEACTHPAALAAFDERDPRWKAHGSERWGVRQQHRQQANLNLLPWEQGFDLDDGYERLFCVSDLDRRVTTRLGMDDRRLKLPPATIGPFGSEIRSVNLPGFWFERRSLPLQEEPDDVEVVDDRMVFSIGDWRLGYDATGLEILDG